MRRKNSKSVNSTPHQFIYVMREMYDRRPTSYDWSEEEKIGVAVPSSAERTKEYKDALLRHDIERAGVLGLPIPEGALRLFSKGTPREVQVRLFPAGLRIDRFCGWGHDPAKLNLEELKLDEVF